MNNHQFALAKDKTIKETIALVFVPLFVLANLYNVPLKLLRMDVPMQIHVPRKEQITMVIFAPVHALWNALQPISYALAQWMLMAANKRTPVIPKPKILTESIAQTIPPLITAQLFAVKMKHYAPVILTL